MHPQSTSEMHFVPAGVGCQQRSSCRRIQDFPSASSGSSQFGEAVSSRFQRLFSVGAEGVIQP